MGLSIIATTSIPLLGHAVIVLIEMQLLIYDE